MAAAADAATLAGHPVEGLAAVLPPHTTSWPAAVRLLHASYVAARESARLAPAPLSVGSRVILDCGRSREIVHVNDSGALSVAKTPILLASLIGEEVGRTYEVADKRGTLRRKDASSSAVPRGADDDENADGAVHAEESGAVPTPSMPASLSATSASSGRVLASFGLPAAVLPTATNALLFDDNRSQRLSHADIVAAKASASTSPAELIALLVGHSATFSAKTEFSQEKYVAKKKRKHVAEAATADANLPATLEAVALKDPSRLLHLRADSIAQILAAANVAQSRYVLVAESAHGNLVAAIARRVGGGDGLVVHVQAIPLDSGVQPAHVGALGSLLTAEEMASIIPAPLALLSHEAALRSAAAVDPASPEPPPLFADAAAVLSEGVDSLVLATRFDCVDLLSLTLPYLRPGGCFVVHSPVAAPLQALHRTLRVQGQAVKVELSESFFREYQVLPNRTHPHVNMSYAAGYLLTGIKTAP